MLSNFITLILILTPLIVGFFLPIDKKWLPQINQALNYVVFTLLLLIGLSLSQVHNIGSQLGVIVLNVVVLAFLTMGGTLVALIAFDKLHPWQRPLSAQATKPKISIKTSLIQLAFILIGFTLGKILPIAGFPLAMFTKGFLMALVGLVGVSLSHAGMTLKEVLLNKRGVQMSVIFCVAMAVMGVVYALIMPDVTITQGLALSSGYGWYSLSGIVMTDRYGAVWGSVALLNDLSREFCTLMFVPLFIQRYPSAGVGLGGVTSMDFSLPVIQASGGNEVVPLAMSFGFIVNIVSPILMVVFTSFG